MWARKALESLSEAEMIDELEVHTITKMMDLCTTPEQLQRLGQRIANSGLASADLKVLRVMYEACMTELKVFYAFQLQPRTCWMWSGEKRASVAQQRAVRRLGYEGDTQQLSTSEAQSLICKLYNQRKRKQSG